MEEFMITKILCVILIGLVSLVGFTSCTTVKTFYQDNKEIIKEIISIILDTLLSQTTNTSAIVPSDNQLKLSTAVPVVCSPDIVISRDSVIRFKTVIESTAFWDTVDAKVTKLLHDKGIN
jgi:hypothetical protein